MGVSGAIRTLSIDGIDFPLITDGDFNRIISKYAKEDIPNSSQSPTVKYTFRTQKLEGVKLSVNAEKELELKELDERIGTYTINYTEMDGSVWRCDGRISTEGRTTQENVAEISIIPDNEWTLFLP